MSDRPDNCLEGMECPQCGQYYRFRIAAEALFNVVDDGTQEYGDVEWYDNNHASCPECEWEGKVRDLYKKSRSEEAIT